jgi:hypothetical protein
MLVDEILAVGNITHHKFCPLGNSGAKTVTQVVVHDDLSSNHAADEFCAPPVTRILTRQFHSQLELRAADAADQPDAPGAGMIQGGPMYARGASPLFEELWR